MHLNATLRSNRRKTAFIEVHDLKLLVGVRVWGWVRVARPETLPGLPRAARLSEGRIYILIHNIFWS